MIVVTEVVEGSSTFTLKNMILYLWNEKFGTPETHPEELVVFKNERQYYKICLFLDNFTTRSSSGWVLAIPKIYIMKKYDVETFKRRFGSSFMIPVYINDIKYESI